MADRLDIPRERGWRFFHRRRTSTDGFGRLVEATTRFMGSPRFILYMMTFVVVWTVVNVLLYQLSRVHAWDLYPFILLNLALSTQVSHLAPLVLLAQNRQDDRDRVQAQQDRQRAECNFADTEYLTCETASLCLSTQEVATHDSLRSEIRDLLSDLREDIRAKAREEMREELRVGIQAGLDETGSHLEVIDEAAPSAEKAEEQSISSPSRAPGNFPDAQANIRWA